MVMYTDGTLASLKKRQNIWYGVMISAASVCIAVCVALCFVLDRGNAVMIEAFNCVLTVICGWFVLGCLFSAVLPNKARIAHVNGMLISPHITLEGDVVACGGQVTVNRYLVAMQVTVSDGQRICYWDDALGKCPFSVGDKVRLEICRNFIYSYEVVENGD